MKKEKVNIVWLKRDLRSQDHEPLFEAEASEQPYLILYIFDTNIINHPDTSVRHLQFIYHSILSLNKTLAQYNRRVEIFYGDSHEIFNYLMEQFLINRVFSYNESGTQITWDRDKKVSELCNQNNIVWKQFQRDGVIRGIKNRKNWTQQWYKTMHLPIRINKFSNSQIKHLDHPFVWPQKTRSKITTYPKHFQPAGEQNGWRYLRSFVAQRGFNYHKKLSKPTESRTSCSRLSPYLSWGNISVKQAYQFISNHSNYERYKRAFSGMLTRLHWHCHFIQKFEVECSYETHCINRGYELLTHKKNNDFIHSWATGTTGYPLVDACMRALNDTGWINFRMRAMLVSFLTFNLDQDWREGIYHLAQLFLDYEPGIHYPQFQMQAGTTGINTVRLYNPVKNAKENDPEGIFIKKWIPELSRVPTSYIHQPWTMSAMEQVFCGVTIGKDYPSPIVDLELSSKAARTKIWSHRKHPEVQKEKSRILNTHVNKKRSAS